MSALPERINIPIPSTAPVGIDLTKADVEDVWDTFVKPSQSDDAPPQSVEMRSLMAILRAVYVGMSEAEEDQR